jgi:hypothetical protein
MRITFPDDGTTSVQVYETLQQYGIELESLNKRGRRFIRTPAPPGHHAWIVPDSLPADAIAALEHIPNVTVTKD